MSIYNSPYFLFKAGSLKGKTKKEIDAFFKRQKDQAKKPKPKEIDPLVKRKAQLAKQYKEKQKLKEMSEKLQVMYFSAPWCGPCKAFGPAFNEVVAEFDDIDVQKINIDENQEAAVNYNVTSIPTVILMKGNTIVFRNKGVMPKNQLKDLIETHKNGQQKNEHEGHILEQTTE